MPTNLTLHRAALVGSLLVCVVGSAHADRYEASIALRPTALWSRYTDDLGARGRPLHDGVYGAGGSLAFGYGVRNWLELGIELSAMRFTEASLEPAAVSINGASRTGTVTRDAQAAHARIGATVRLGVAWVPTLHAGIGAGARHRSAAVLTRDDSGAILNLVPDGLMAETTVDLVAVARVGLEHRLGRRWAAGVHVGAQVAVGIGAPTLPALGAGLSVSYSWYPAL